MYENLKFKSEKEFNGWLQKTAKYKIEFEDNGQDFLTWWVGDAGEVLHSDMQSRVWNGKSVWVGTLKEGCQPKFKRGGSLTHKIKKVTILT